MRIKLEYSDAQNRTQIMNANSGLYLIEEQNITDGNFLILTDEKPLSEQVLEVKEKQFATNKMLSENSLAQQELLELLLEMGII